MSAIIDLAGARRRRQLREGCRPCRGSGASLRPALDEAYERLGPPGAPITMPDELRRWLRGGVVGHRSDHVGLHTFVDEHGPGLAATLEGARHDPAAQRLLAPELLLVMLGLETDPHSLRACWPPTRDVSELLTLADLFGRPFGD